MILKPDTAVSLLTFLPIFWAHYCIMRLFEISVQVTGLGDLLCPATVGVITRSEALTLRPYVAVCDIG